MNHNRRANLDCTPDAVMQLSLAGLATAAEGTSPSAGAARAALTAYEREIGEGSSEADAATIAKHVLLSALRG